MKNNEYIYQLLDWNSSIQEQERGIELASHISDIGMFLQPGNKKYNKNVWENCAKILSFKTDNELEPYIIQLLEWLQDLNWPGTFIIIDRLIRFDGKLLLPPFIDAICIAKNGDDCDAEWLKHMTKLLENTDLAARLDRDLYTELNGIYTKFWCGC